MDIMFTLILFGSLSARSLKFTGDLLSFLPKIYCAGIEFEFSTEWTINILPTSEIDKIVSNPLAIFNNETLPDGSTLNDCTDLEAFLTSQNSTYTEGNLKLALRA